MLEGLIDRQSPLEDPNEAERVLSDVNLEIEKNPRFKTMLAGLTAEGQEDFAVARVMEHWASQASTRSVVAVAALVVAGGFMWKGWHESVKNEELRGFVAAKACQLLMSVEKYESAAISGKSHRIIDGIIKPVVLLGHTLKGEGRELFLKAADRNPYPSGSIYTIRRLLGFKTK